MAERKGNISVNTQDIFPIIKKWLYSEHDIFLRELVANACDAITKRASLARTRNVEVAEGAVEIKVDKKAKTITITDNGLGMTEEEVEKYIAQLAFSGAEEFVKNMKDAGADSKNDIIGKFGLGFYSSFMVADTVTVESLSMNEGAKAVKWSCSGDVDYTFEDSNKKEIGTTITLYVNKESEDFLNGHKVISTLKNHCDFMPYPITVNDLEREKSVAKDIEENAKLEADKQRPITPYTPTIVNNTEPLWKKDPSTLKDEDYKTFYRELFPMDGDPLFWIHLKVDHPFTLEGILYFPKFNPQKPVNERNIRMYCKQVFVSDDVKNVIPEYLSLLKGTVDSTDIPLNVSRSSLQGDPNIRRISNYITKKVGEALKKLFKNDRERYEEIWQDIHLFVKYGTISDEKFDEVMRPYVLFKNSEDKLVTLNEYKESTPEAYKEKLKDKVIYAQKEKSDNSLKEQLLSEGVHVIETEDYIDPHFMQNVEMKKQGDDSLSFVSIDSEIENILSSENTTDADMKLKDIFKEILVGPEASEEEKKSDPMKALGGLEIDVKKLKNSTHPAYFKVDEQMKRMQQMTQQMGNMMGGNFPIKRTLVINPANPLIQNTLKIWEKGNKNLAEKICYHVQDLADISSEGLNKEQKDAFVTRSQKLIQELSQFAL
jgi:molecular chaperone HtpG